MSISSTIRPNRPLSKLAPTNKVQGVYGAEDRNVLQVHEDLSTGATQQFDDGVEFRKRSNIAMSFKEVMLLQLFIRSCLICSAASYIHIEIWLLRMPVSLSIVLMPQFSRYNFSTIPYSFVTIYEIASTFLALISLNTKNKTILNTLVRSSLLAFLRHLITSTLIIPINITLSMHPSL
jgi:hypothetical protein